MKRIFAISASLGLVLMLSSLPKARASSISWACASTCGGGVLSQSGNNFSTSTPLVLIGFGPGESTGELYSTAFSTSGGSVVSSSSGTIVYSGSGSLTMTTTDSDLLTAVFTKWTYNSCATISLDISNSSWNLIGDTGVFSVLGAAGADTLNIDLSNPFSSGSANVSSADLTINSVPEPATLSLLGFGLLALGLFRKRVRLV